MNDGPALSSLVVNELFREKTDYGMRVSEMTFEKERVQMAADEIFAR